MGDTFVNGFFPFVDEESGGSIDGLIASANRVLEAAKPGTKIVPGHGPLATPEDLEGFRDMLVTVRERVAKGLASGATLGAFIETKPLADLEAVWGDGFLKTHEVITLVWMSLGGHR
jgi:glyoxylase-like metal-dependent hydrolase (beta-lactamase superfamily II)